MAHEYTITRTDDGQLFLLKNGQVQERLFRMKEALQKTGITAPTYYRWVNSGQIVDVTFRDRSNWRLFTDSDIQRIKSEANRVQVVIPVSAGPNAQEPGESS
jgi:hypothetical protein